MTIIIHQFIGIPLLMIVLGFPIILLTTKIKTGAMIVCTGMLLLLALTIPLLCGNREKQQTQLKLPDKYHVSYQIQDNQFIIELDTDKNPKTEPEKLIYTNTQPTGISGQMARFINNDGDEILLENINPEKIDSIKIIKTTFTDTFNFMNIKIKTSEKKHVIYKIQIFEKEELIDKNAKEIKKQFN